MELITNLLGTPTLQDMRSCAPGAIRHMMKSPKKQPSHGSLYSLSKDATHEAVHLVCEMLVFDPVSMLTSLYLWCGAKNRIGLLTDTKDL